MDERYVKSFLDAFVNVLPQFGISDIKKFNISLKDSHIKSAGVIIILGILGDVKGNVMYTTTLQCAQMIVSNMMTEMSVHELNELAQSALSELANMLTSNAATSLSNENINIDISTPTVMYGNFTARASSSNILCIEMLINGMPFQVNVSVEN